MPFLNIAALRPVVPSAISTILPQNMVFNGADELTAITTDREGNSVTATVVGAPVRGSNGGYIIGDDAGTNYVRITLPAVASPATSHLALFYAPDPTDTVGILLAGSPTNNTDYVGTFQDGDASTLLTNANAVTSYHSGGSSLIDGVATRDQMATLVAGSGGQRVVVLRDLSMGNGTGEVIIGRYVPESPSVHFKQELIGLMLFSDFADAADAETKLPLAVN